MFSLFRHRGSLIRWDSLLTVGPCNAWRSVKGSIASTLSDFRQWLSRARGGFVEIMQAKCGRINPAAARRCRRRVHTAVAPRRLDLRHLLHASNAGRAGRFPEVLREIRKLDELRRAAALYRAQPAAGRFDFTGQVRKLPATHPAQ